MDRTDIAVIIPAYNEEERIGPTLEAMIAYFSARPESWRLIVVNDGSRDRTLEVVQSVARDRAEITLIDSQPNRGKGHAVRTGMLAAQADLLLMSDADLATPIEELEKLRARISDKNPVVIGSRPLRDSNLEVRQPLWREIGGRAFNKFIQAVGVWGVADTQCGFKLFREKEAHDIFRRCKLNGWGFDFEAMMIARDLGLTITEVGVRWRHMEGSKFEPLKEAPKMLRELFRLRLMGRTARLKIPEGRE